MSKSLVAARLYQAMANEAADDDLDVEIYDELKSYSKYFEDLCKSLNWLILQQIQENIIMFVC